jgi:hypothetical protein
MENIEMPRSEHQEILRIKWTPAKLEEVRKFVDEEVKYPESPQLRNFMDGLHRHKGELAWSETPIVASDKERERILKAMYYDETAPSGMTKMIKELNKKYIGFTARGVRAWVRKQQAY